jgi:hypothetical protein
MSVPYPTVNASEALRLLQNGAILINDIDGSQYLSVGGVLCLMSEKLVVLTIQNQDQPNTINNITAPNVKPSSTTQ